MVVERINPPGLCIPEGNAYVHVTRASGDLHFRVSGQTAVDAEGTDLAPGDFAAQTNACFDATGRALESVGVTWSDVTHMFVFATDLDAYAVAEVPIMRKYFGSSPPAVTAVQVSRLFSPDWLIEIQVDAQADSTRLGTTASNADR